MSLWLYSSMKRPQLFQTTDSLQISNSRWATNWNHTPTGLIPADTTGGGHKNYSNKMCQVYFSEPRGIRELEKLQLCLGPAWTGLGDMQKQFQMSSINLSSYHNKTSTSGQGLATTCRACNFLQHSAGEKSCWNFVNFLLISPDLLNMYELY